MALNTSSIRRQFPFLSPPSGEAIAYLDNAATTQTPQGVIDAMTAFMSGAHGNVHRGQHQETEISTDAYEAARRAVQRFIGAAHADEIIFTKNATEAINLAAHGWAARNLKAGDCIVISKAEHHANVVPWMQIREQQPDVTLIWIDVREDGSLDEDALRSVLTNNTVKLVALTGQSNVLGTRWNIAAYADVIHEHGARLLVDAAQLAGHAPIDVAALGCDFLAFSGHKVYGPTGIGVLYASRDAMKDMKPFMGGGGMVQHVGLDGFTPADPPARFEAGTPPVSDAIGLAAAINWQRQFSWADREAYELTLMTLALGELARIDGLRVLGPGEASRHHGCLSLTINGVHPHDLTDIAGKNGVALRGGHHCAQPLHDRLGISASTRLSTALYTSEDDIRRAASVIREACSVLR